MFSLFLLLRFYQLAFLDHDSFSNDVDEADAHIDKRPHDYRLPEVGDPGTKQDPAESPCKGEKDEVRPTSAPKDRIAIANEPEYGLQDPNKVDTRIE